MNDYTMEELMPVFTWLSKRYTSNESSSIPYDTARRLMESIVYCMEGATDTDYRNVLSYTGKQTDSMAIYRLGLKVRQELIEKTKQKYKDIETTFHDYGNQCYKDTIVKGMPAFFLHYDLNYDATNTILTLDYPLIRPVKENQGIDAIYEYLMKTDLEQKCLRVFSEEKIQCLLEHMGNDSGELIVNVCELVLDNGIGCIMAGKPYTSVVLSYEDMNQLYEQYGSVTERELRGVMMQAFESIMSDFVEEERAYFLPVVESLFVYFREGVHNKSLSHVFVTDVHNKHKNNIEHIDGNNMEDEVLRDLLERLSKLKMVSDKIALVRQYVHSFADLEVLLNEGFYKDEYEEVFALFSEQEKEMMRGKLLEKRMFSTLEEWELCFLK